MAAASPAVLLDRAAFDGEEIASAAVSAEVRFASEEERAEFLREYLQSTRELLERYERKQERNGVGKR